MLCKDDSQEMSNEETNTSSSSQQGAEDVCVCLCFSTWKPGCYRTRPSHAAYMLVLQSCCKQCGSGIFWLHFNPSWMSQGLTASILSFNCNRHHVAFEVVARVQKGPDVILMDNVATQENVAPWCSWSVFISADTVLYLQGFQGAGIPEYHRLV